MLVETKVEVAHGDIDDRAHNLALMTGAIAWDIETSGLDWRAGTIGTCQIAVGECVFVVILGSHVPQRLRSLLADDKVQKVFHHAPFDLRFMTHQWRVSPANVACTKVATKILEPDLDRTDYSLRSALQRHLSVEILKDQQLSDWLSPNLSPDQLRYAVDDVRHLVALRTVLEDKCRAARVDDLLRASWHYLTTRVALDIRGAGDVFQY